MKNKKDFKKKIDNPYNKHERRLKKLPIKVNDYDLYDLKFNAQREDMRQSDFIRHKLKLAKISMGPKKGSKNAKKKI